MRKNNGLEEFEMFAEGMKKASNILKSKNPDYVFAPVLGSVPFVDLLKIVDRHFELDSVEYPPNSSRFRNREEIMAEWYKNFLDTNYAGEKIKIVCIDEVISGSSALKGYKEFNKALHEYQQNKHPRAGKKINYELLGISEPMKDGKRNKGLEGLVRKNKAHLVNVGNILTADDMSLNPVRLKVEGQNSQGRHIYSPEIDRFEISNKYLTFLQNFAQYIGRDPSKVTVQNIGRIRESMDKYLGRFNSE